MMEVQATVVAIPDDDMEAIIAEAKAKRDVMLKQIINELEGELQTCITDRAEVDSRLAEAEKQYHGKGGTKPAKSASGALLPEAGAERYPSEDNITRRITLITASRWQNMMVPTSDRNFETEATPVPEPSNPQALTGKTVNTPEGQVELTAEDQAQILTEVAGKASKKMQKYIDDDLTECHFPNELRKVIFSACHDGTGVMIGPFVKSTYKKVRRKVSQVDPVTGLSTIMWTIELVPQNKPVLEHVPTVDFFPKKSRCIQECPGFFIRKLMTRKQMQGLAKSEGFDKEAINELLQSDPGDYSPSSGGLAINTATAKDRYTVWVYHGSFPSDIVKLMNPELPIDDELTEMSGEIWFCNGRALKASQSHLDGQDRLPCYVLNYEKDPNDIFGYGVPWVLRHDQNGIHTLFDSMMVNGVASAGVILAILKGALVPQQGERGLTIGEKPISVVLLDETQTPGMDAGKAVQSILIPNTIGQTMPLYELLKQNGEEHALMAFVAQGDQNKAFGTAFGAGMMTQQSNIVQRRFATQTDDELIVPAIEMMYDHHMMYNPDESAKVDMKVVPKGVTHLLAKELQAWNLQALTQMAANPLYAPFFKPQKIAELTVTMMDMASRGIVKTDAEIEADQQKAQPPPEDPRVTAENIRAQSVLAQEQAETERMQQRAQVDLAIADKRLLEVQMKLATDERVSMQQVHAQFNLDMETEKTARLTAMLNAKEKAADRGAKVQLEVAKLDQKQRETDIELAVEAPNVRLA